MPSVPPDSGYPAAPPPPEPPSAEHPNAEHPNAEHPNAEQPNAGQPYSGGYYAPPPGSYEAPPPGSYEPPAAAHSGYPAAPAYGGYPPAQPGYPSAQPGYPNAQPGYQPYSAYPPQSGYQPYPGYQSHPGYPPQSGYQPYPGFQGGYPGAPGRLQYTRGLRIATTVLFWVVVGCALLLSIAFFSRRGTWDDWRNGAATIQSLRDADSFVSAMAGLQILGELAAVIVVSLYSRRVVANAQARGVPDLSPGLACGGWYIPFGSFFVGFNQLRKAVKGVGGASPTLLVWQLAFAATAIVSGISSAVVGQISTSDTAADVASRLTSQSVIGLISFLGFAVSAAAATVAMRQIDQAINGTV